MAQVYPRTESQLLLKNTYSWSIYAELSGQQKKSFSQHVDIHLCKEGGKGYFDY